ncbi:phage tail protein [Labedaea rhizosphaerae]|uniref:Phage tail-like protein n=1 Tax=Labedaea rhizosphaerae TaxID=598644 RepID=A0A4R6SH72_LABRH|nr:phage tail protein [Labedaea rhizosphaerae]TDQ01145.1 phage tail-like protein [Labedaea rhizosphaerae]
MALGGISGMGAPSKMAELLTGQVGMSHRFVVRIDDSDYDLGSWQKVSGLKVTWQKASWRPGNSNDERISSGNISYSNIKLSRAACSDSAVVQKWLAKTSRHRQPLSGAIFMVDFVGLPVIEWTLKEFFPVGWDITDFDATGAKAAVESLELAHTGFLNDEGMAST